jgi:hypothetical protein
VPPAKEAAGVEPLGGVLDLGSASTEAAGERRGCRLAVEHGEQDAELRA